MKKLLLSMLGVSLLLLVSCAQETQRSGGGGISSGKMKLSVELDKLTRNSSTRNSSTRTEVPSEEGEDRVNSLFLLFFDGSDNGSGTFEGYTEVEMPESVPVTNPDGNYSMNLEAVISYPDGLDVSGDYSILALANISDNVYIDGSVEDWMMQWEGQTESYVIMHAKANIPAGSFSPSQLLMHGSQRKPAGDNQVHMLLKRDVARIDVTKAPELIDWEIATVSIWNSFPGTYIFDSGMMDYTDNTERVRRHYAITPNTDAGNIKGGLYAFENQVGKPESNDQVSTCLVIGLKNVDSGVIEYFRANLQNDTGAQHLRRNYAYNLVIEGKDGTGENNEETAYLGESNKLIYTIDEWEVDPNGLVVRDEYSTLSIPTKTVNMGGKAAVAEFKIHTFSTLPSPSPLQIRSQTYRPATNGAGDPPITARLDGNTLVIESTDLEGLETQRNGVIVLSYAGLEISMNISQAGKHDHFLIVTEPDGGILPFAAYAGIPSGLIRVQASGHWTAQLYMTGFSFDASQASDPVKMIWTNPASPGDPDYTFTDGRGYNTTTGLIIPDETDPSVDKFRIYTHSHNMGQTPRRAMIVITLDGMEDKYQSVIQLTQNYVKELHYVHSAGNPENEEERVSSGGTITFDGMGTVPTTGSYAGNNDWWYVFSGYEEGTTKILPWSAQMVISGGADDRSHFEIVRNVDGEPVIPNATNYDAATVSNNKVRVRAKGMNISGRDYKVTLRVQTDPGTFADIEVVQEPAQFNFNPGVIRSTVSPYGGLTEKVGVNLGTATGLFWRVTEIERTQVMSPVQHRMLQGHGAVSMMVYDENGDEVEPVVLNKQYPQEYKFAVKFPQIYYPNRGIQVGANVTVAVSAEGDTTGGMFNTIIAEQDPLVSRGVKAAARGFWEYGLYHTSARAGTWWTQYFNGKQDAAAVGWSQADNVSTTSALGSTALVQSAPTNLTYLHFDNDEVTDIADTEHLAAANAVINGRKWMDANGGGMTVIFNSYDGTGRIGVLNHILGAEGYAFRSSSAWSDDAWQNMQPDFTETKLYHMIAEEPYYVYQDHAVPYVFHDNSNDRYGYQSDTGIATTSEPGSAIKVAVGSTRDGRDVQNEGAIVIDPKRRVMYVADAWFFNPNWVSEVHPWTSPHHVTFAYALRIFATKTAQYGSSFSDMFIEPDWAGPGTVDPQAVPAPWDPHWGDNALDLRDGDRGGRYSIRSAVSDE